MKIVSIHERTVPLESETSNAAISFSTMTASAVVVEIETAKGRFKGLGFSSYGRYGHGGLLNERFIPRILNAQPEDFIDQAEGNFSMLNFWDVLMQNEKEGGHGERSGAVGVIETAMWDAWAKSEDLPLWALLARDVGHADDGGVAAGETVIYGSGGHYRTDVVDAQDIADEARKCFGDGYAWFKIKVGGASPVLDNKRIEAAIRVAGASQLIAVEANCSFGNNGLNVYLKQIDEFSLRWIEEPVNPLDYEALTATVKSIQTPVATGENIFAVADVVNLLRYGGLTPGRDTLQMDIVLSYGITEFLRMLSFAESGGWSRRDFIPHAGHQLALHVSSGLGLGGHETASVLDTPFSGVSDDTKIADGYAYLSDKPGIGIEYKPSLYKYFDGMLN